MKQLAKVIGIISYLPDNPEKREIRLALLKKLITDCNSLFIDLPIIIIAQNWPEDLYKDTKNITIYRYKEPLTIVGARIKLREIFLESSYDYLIMLDDDCEISGTPEGVKNYLDFIDNNPDCWITKHGSLLKLFAISKTIMKQVEYDIVRLEYLEGYEDTIFFNKLLLFHESAFRHFPYEAMVQDRSHSTADENSTWYRPGVDLRELQEKTRTILKKYDKREKPIVGLHFKKDEMPETLRKNLEEQLGKKD